MKTAVDEFEIIQNQISVKFTLQKYRVGQKKRTQISNLYILRTVISINAILSISYL